MLLPNIQRRTVAVSPRRAAGFSLLELSLSLALGLVVLSLAVNAMVVAQRQWHQQQRGWQALLSLQFIAHYLTQELQQASPGACPDRVVVPLPHAVDAHQLRYVRCEDGQLNQVRVWQRRNTLYRAVNGDKALQLLTGVTHFEVHVVTTAAHQALVELQVAVQAGEVWPITVMVRGT